MTEVVLITGTATGIGRALAIDMHGRHNKDGKKTFKVYATDYRLELLEELESMGMQALQLDVTDTESISAAVAHIEKADGRIDVLICNAGMALPGWISEIDYNHVERIFNVNVHGVFRCVQAVAKGMMTRQSGKIAIMASVNSYYVAPFNASYSGTKAAVLSMTETLSQELYPFNIKITTVIPGWVKSDIINSHSENFERFERPESFFQHTIGKIRERRAAGIKQGSTTAEAARDIANGMAKARPPRHLYTGTTVRYALFWGFVQMWIRPQFLADSLAESSNLHVAAKLAPREWKGPYVEPQKAPIAA